jgi:hypothetical protein
MDKQALSPGTVLMKSSDMTGRSKHRRGMAGGEGGKDDRKNTLAPIEYVRYRSRSATFSIVLICFKLSELKIFHEQGHARRVRFFYLPIYFEIK